MSPPRRAADYRLDPFDLQLFAAVVAHGSLTAGAQASSLSLAAASARVAALEHRVGTPLLQRAKTGSTPTDAGHALARQARRVLAEIGTLHDEMAAFGRGLRGRVRLACNTAATTGRLPEQLGRFLRGRPEVDVALQERASDEVLQALREGEADAGIVADHVEPTGLDVRPWGEDRLFALLPPGHAAAGRDAVAFAELLDAPLVGLGAERGLSRFLARRAADGGRVPQHRVRVDGFDTAARLVAAGAGAAVLPLGAALRAGAASGLVVPLADGWARRRLLLCTPSAAALRPAVRALVDALVDDAGDEPADPPPGKPPAARFAR